MSVGREGMSGGQSGFPSSELRGVASALVDQTLVGLICLDHRGVIVESNARAREVLGADGGLRERNGRLGTHRPDDAAVFERLLQAALDGSAVPGVGASTVLGAWPGQRPLTVHVNPVPLAPDGGSSVAALVTIIDPWVKIPVDPVQVGVSLGLTPAESGVAAWLAEGSTVGEIAEATDRSPQTVRWLVKRALAKTWCRRQADLVRLVLSTSRLPVPQPVPQLAQPE